MLIISKFSQIAFVALILSGVACEPIVDDEVSVEVNGSLTDFSQEVRASRSIVTETIDVIGESEDGHTVRISFPSDDTGIFTENDVDAEAGAFAPQYAIMYQDAKDNLYHWDGGFEDEGSFTIEVLEFDNHSGGTISGTFEAELPGNLGNGDAAEPHMSLTGGTFTVTLDSEL